MKLLIWDFDGTLAFREGLWSSAVAEVACAHIPGCQAARADFLSHLQSGFPWHSPELPHTHIGLTPHMAQVFSSATLGYEKPHPKSFGAVLGAFPDAARAVMVGDNYAVDVQGAEAMGLSAILVRRPNAGATAFHESLTSLAPVLMHAGA
jgi:phosphoglycolate phosphatase-like HAD superfamily hydrolase